VLLQHVWKVATRLLLLLLLLPPLPLLHEWRVLKGQHGAAAARCCVSAALLGPSGCQYPLKLNFAVSPLHTACLWHNSLQQALRWGKSEWL